VGVDDRIILKYISGEMKWCNENEKKTAEDSEQSRVRQGCQKAVVPGSK
jgi:transcriptional/translational regulatory protein YebC/TACO1